MTDINHSKQADALPALDVPAGPAADLLRRLEIYTLCPKCSQESRVPGSINGAGFISNMHDCPHCGTRIDTWLRIPAPNTVHEPQAPQKIP